MLCQFDQVQLNRAQHFVNLDNYYKRALTTLTPPSFWRNSLKARSVGAKRVNSPWTNKSLTAPRFDEAWQDDYHRNQDYSLLVDSESMWWTWESILLSKWVSSRRAEILQSNKVVIKIYRGLVMVSRSSPTLHISIDRELGTNWYTAPAMTVRSWDLSIAAIPLPEDPRTPGDDKKFNWYH